MAQSYKVVVQVKDTVQSLAVNQSLIVHVINVNEAPTAISLDSTSVEENSPKGVRVGNINVTDPDEAFASQRITCGLRNDAGGRFRVSGLSVEVAVSHLLDYESASSGSYLIEVECQDQDGATVHHQFQIQLRDVNEPPERIESTTGAFEVRCCCC